MSDLKMRGENKPFTTPREVRFLERQIAKLEAKLEAYEGLRMMLVGAIAWTQEYGNGNVSALVLQDFIGILDKALEQKT